MLLFRRRRMIQRRRDHIRIVDDGFLIWNDTKGPRNFRTGIPLSLLNFRARLHRDTHLDFTWDDNCTKEAVFLDVTILKKHTHYETRTFQKALNLYLYLPPFSAHPPGVLKSLVYGRIIKFRTQNSSEKDYFFFCKQLFRRLILRGYSIGALRAIFKQAMDTTQPRKSTPKQVLLKLPYDPTGPTFNHMKSIFEFEKLEQFWFEMDADKLTLCFRRPPPTYAIIASIDQGYKILHSLLR